MVFSWNLIKLSETMISKLRECDAVIKSVEKKGDFKPFLYGYIKKILRTYNLPQENFRSESTLKYFCPL